jgi:hypothetical protein
VEYTYCHSKGDREKKCAEIVENVSLSCLCEVTFELEEDIEQQVYLYYGLSNFYQVIQTKEYDSHCCFCIDI